MKPAELRGILADLKMSRGGFGILLGASRRSGEMWTDDETKKVPGPVATVARLLQARPELLTLLKAMRGTDDS